MEIKETIQSYIDTGSVHALCLVASPDAGADMLSEVLGEDVTLGSNPDILYRNADTISVEEARALALELKMKPLTERKVVILSVNYLRTDVQNSLLKATEEPGADNIFVLILPQSKTLLPTLLSRLQLVELADTETSKEVKKFLASSTADRLKQIGKFVRNKDRAGAYAFIGSLIAYARRAIIAGNNRDVERSLQSLAIDYQYILDPVSSVKQILEHAAIVTPVIK